ncbi:MAG: hypothetical protein AAGB16_06850 [Pseudomonadota bacterium]
MFDQHCIDWAAHWQREITAHAVVSLIISEADRKNIDIAPAPDGTIKLLGDDPGKLATLVTYYAEPLIRQLKHGPPKFPASRSYERYRNRCERSLAA